MTDAPPHTGEPHACRRCRAPSPDCECTAIELGHTVHWHDLRAALVDDYRRAHQALAGAAGPDHRIALADKAAAASALACLLVAAGEAPDFDTAAAAVEEGRLPELRADQIEST